MFTEKELDEIEARHSAADIPALVAEARRFNQVVNAAFNLKEARSRVDQHHKNFIVVRDNLMEKEEELQAALIRLLEGEGAEAEQ